MNAFDNGTESRATVVVYESQSALEENWAEREVKNALRANESKSSHAVVHPIQATVIGRSDENGPQGKGYADDGEPMFTLNTIDRHAIAFSHTQGLDPQASETATPTLQANGGGQAVAIPLDLRNALRDPEKHDELNRQGVGVGEAGDPAPTVTSAAVHGVVAFNLHSGSKRADRPEGGMYVNETEIARTLDTAGGLEPTKNDGGLAIVAPTLSATNNPSRSPQSSEVTAQVEAMVNATSIVRRLTPVECERLQGFPDNWTAQRFDERKATVVNQPDSARYKQMGNAVAVPVFEWVISRLVDYERKT